MREKLSKSFSCALVTLLVLGMLGVFYVLPVKADPTNLEVINPLDGTHDFNFTADTMSVGDTFIINITVVDVTDLATWQIRLEWDSSLLTYSGIWLPADHVFSEIAPPRAMITPPPIVGPGYVVWGCTYINSPYWTFNGTGQICQVELEITQGVSSGGPTEVSCDLILADVGTNTFLTDGALHDITFSAVNGHYYYEWVAPPIPTIYIKPATYKASVLDETVALEVWVENVYAGWELIGFQFSVMWNTTLLEPLAPYYTNGTFMETFQYGPSGVLYASSINQHVRIPPLSPIPDYDNIFEPGDYNFSMFGCMLLPDSPEPYHSPFPQGEGLLMTIYFKAIYETLSPDEEWTWIEFITFAVDEDCYALDKYLHVIPVNTENCHYRCPMKVLGLNIDLYTQYDTPYGGQGADQPSDMFGPQEEVILCALVTYNEWPVQQKLVGFEIRHGDYQVWREATTDSFGVACISFRPPWPCDDPESEIFGKWNVIATVEVAEMVENDTLGFWVYWKAFVISVEPKSTEFYHHWPKGPGDDMGFTVEYATYSMQVINVTLTVVVYDELGFFIGSAYLDTTVGWDAYMYYDFGACEEPPLDGPYTHDFYIPMPSNAVVGKGAVYANAFDKFPWIGGTPYCPEVTNTIDFYISPPI